MTDMFNPDDMNEPDLVDRIFDYLLQEVPGFADAVRASKLAEMKNSVRAEFEGIDSGYLLAMLLLGVIKLCRCCRFSMVEMPGRWLADLVLVGPPCIAS